MTTGTRMPDGTTCYSGPDCKKHGFLNQLQRRIQKIDKTVTLCFNYPKHNLPDAEPSTSATITGLNTDPAVKSKHVEQLDDESRHLEAVLSNEERQTLKLYIASYEHINSNLRNGDNGLISYLSRSFDWDENYAKENLDTYRSLSEKRIKEMDAIFKKYKRPENNVRVLYRKTTTDDLSEYKIGDTFEEKGYMSTSIDPDAVLAHRPYLGRKHEVVLEVLSRNGIPIHEHDSHDGEPSHSEREVLLNRGGKFTITNIREATLISSYPDRKPSRHLMYRDAQPEGTFTVVTMVEQ